MKKAKKFVALALTAVVMATSSIGVSVMPVSAKTLAESWQHGTRKLCGYRNGMNVWTKDCWSQTVGYTNKNKRHFCDAAIGKGKKREAHKRVNGYGDMKAYCVSKEYITPTDSLVQGWMLIPTAYATYGWGK